MKYLVKFRNVEPIKLNYVDGLLQNLDFTSAGFNAEQISFILRQIPAKETAFIDWTNVTKSLETCTLEHRSDIPFETWYNDYPKKVDAKKCRDFWDKRMTAQQHLLAWRGLRRYLKHLQENQWQNVAYPLTFLRGAKYENEEF